MGQYERTYSMKQSSSWKANRFSDYPEIPRIFGARRQNYNSRNRYKQ
jgi:hypothetical protein